MSDVSETTDVGKDFVRRELLDAPTASNLNFNEKVKALQASGERIFHFGFGQSPFPVPDCLVEALRSNAHRSEYLNITGLPSLRTAVTDLHRREDGLTLDPGAIVVGPGSKELLYLTMAVSTGAVVIPAPAWTTYAPQVRLAGRLDVVVAGTEPGRLGGARLTAALLQQALLQTKGKTTFLILTNPGNPSGTCYTKQEMQEIASVCREHRVVVLSDEIYARLTFQGPHQSMAAHYPEGTILFSGMSKFASAGGWRLGYAHYPAPLASLRRAVTAAASQTYSCAPAPVQYAVAQALQESYDDLLSYTKDCTEILRALGDHCYRELASVGVAGTCPAAGYYFMPDFSPLREELAARGITTGPQLMEALLREARVALMSSSHFLMPETDLSTRFCFVCFDGGKALEALREMRRHETLDEAAPTVSPAVRSSNPRKRTLPQVKATVSKKIRSNTQGQETITKEFLYKYCAPVVEGVQALKEWILKLKQE